MSNHLHSSLTACRARLAKCAERVEAAEAKYEAELATAEDARVAILVTRRDDARRAYAVEQDRERSILAAIDLENEAKRREAEAAVWDQVQALTEQRTKAAAAVEKAAREMGEAWTEVQQVTEAARELMPATVQRGTARQSDDIRYALANTLVRVGVRGIIPNDGDVLPSHLGLADRVADSNRGALAGWGRNVNG